jgi:hypothetical protein
MRNDPDYREKRYAEKRESGRQRKQLLRSNPTYRKEENIRKLERWWQRYYSDPGFRQKQLELKRIQQARNRLIMQRVRELGVLDKVTFGPELSCDDRRTLILQTVRELGPLGILALLVGAEVKKD